VPNADSPAILTVFRSRLHPGAEALGYHEVAAEMERRARAMPGFLDYKTFTADDGERVSIVVFDGIENHDRWRDHPDHRAAQQHGREDFYTEYRITVGEVLREHSFASGRRTAFRPS
jgi:heme-degrading monooxygenase HmoA